MTVWTPTDDGHADLTSHDTFTQGAPQNTFARLRLSLIHISEPTRPY